MVEVVVVVVVVVAARAVFISNDCSSSLIRVEAPCLNAVDKSLNPKQGPER